MTGPQPTTTEGYIIQIFERVNALAIKYDGFIDQYNEDQKKGCEDFDKLCQRIDKHESRIVALESTDKTQASWQSFAREAVQDFLKLLVGAAITAALFLWGIK